ncbi:MAG: hypothetical protein PWP58_1240 [Bacillota bacterium]|nr:hypothetical protein [Bacillota bacterium]MDK2784929.1 hypothetical protein [Bacillota bacterium]MDK2882904.1 hypothetical protein [Bacillota bacterium]
MEQEALGLIETVGLAAAVEGADAAVKAANVRLLGYELTRGGGMVTVKITGDVSAVQAAVTAGAMAASRVGKVVSKLVIPRPHEDLAKLIHSPETVGEKKPLRQTGEEKTAAEEEGKPAEEAREFAAEAGPAGTVAGPETPGGGGTATAEAETEDAVEPKTAPAEPGETIARAAGRGHLAAAPLEGSPEPVLRAAAEAEKPPVTEVCNLCGDPACPRRKGEPRSRCIHFAE